MAWPADYDTFQDPNSGDPGNNPSRAAVARKQHAVLTALEHTFGVNPQGAHASIAARLDAIEASGGGGGLAVAGNDPTILALNQTITKGAPGYNSLTVSGILLTGLARPNMVWCIDPFIRGKAETFPVWTASAGSIYLGGPTQDHSTPIRFRYNHSSGARIMVMYLPDLTPMLLGAEGDGVNDDWLYVQMALISWGAALGAQAYGPGAVVPKYKMTKPISTVDHGSIREMNIKLSAADYDAQCIQSGLTAHGGSTFSDNTPQVTVAESINNFQVVSNGPGMVVWGDNLHLGVGDLVRFTSLWDRAIPGGIHEGRHYLVLTKIAHANVDGSTACQITVAELATPTTPIAMTPGNGETFSGFGSQIHNYSDLVSIESDVAGVTLFAPQSYNQPSYSANLFLAGLSAGGNEIIGIVGGDLSEHRNLNIRVGRTGAKTGAFIFGNANTYTNINIDGLDPADPSFLGNLAALGVSLNGKGNYIARLYVRGVGTGVSFAGNDSNMISLIIYEHVTGGTGAAIDPGGVGSASSWQIEQIMCDQLNVPLVVMSGMPTITTWDGSPNSGVGDTDEHGVFPGIYHHGGLGVVLPRRFTRSWTASGGDYAFRRIIEGLNLTSDASCAVKLSNPAGWAPSRHWIAKSSGTGTLTIKDHTGATLTSVTAAGMYRALFTDHWIIY